MGGANQGCPRPRILFDHWHLSGESDGGNHDAGFDLSFRGTGVIMPAEVGWLPGHAGTGLPGEYVFGGYYNSSDARDVLLDVTGSSAGLTGAPFTSHNGRWGLYTLATQMVYREPSNAKRGLTLFGVATVADPQTATFRYFFAAGGSYQGTFRGRDDDFVSLLFAYVRINNRLTNYQEDLRTGIVSASGHPEIRKRGGNGLQHRDRSLATTSPRLAIRYSPRCDR